MEIKIKVQVSIKEKRNQEGLERLKKIRLELENYFEL